MTLAQMISVCRRSLLLGICLWLCGCAGYKLGNQNLFRPDVRTVHVPIIESESFRQGLGRHKDIVTINRLNNPLRFN